MKEFEEENKAGIALNAPNRNYKDDNHKPELMVALSEFWLLHGFKHPEPIKESIRHIPGFSFMTELFQEGRYDQLYGRLMELEQQQVNDILQPLLDRIIPLYRDKALPKHSPDFWAARAALSFNEPGRIDRGIFSIYLLNLVNLQPGEAIFQDAGVLHAYLEGQNMEIMANSDNVLRGGLTSKHIDVKELMKHVSFGPITPSIIYPTRKSYQEEVYVSPAADFQLSRITLNKSQTFLLETESTDIFLVMQGEVEWKEAGRIVFQARRGEAAVAFAGASITAMAIEDAVLFRATVPNNASE
jgi:mannose-6-phosphate isomerase